MNVGGATFACCALMLAGAGCSMNEPTYFPAGTVIDLGGEPGTSTEAFVTVELPFRGPTADEQMALADESQQLGFAAPWLRTNRVGIAVLYTVTNLGPTTAQARLELDGASEFANYDVVALRAAAAAAAINNEDEIEVLPLLGLRVIVEPGAHVTGVVREDDLAEVALDLDALGRFSAPAAAVLINASGTSDIGLEMLPPRHLRPALFRLRVALVPLTGEHLRLQFVVRVRDEGGQLRDGGDAGFAPAPIDYVTPMPPAP